MGSSYFDAHSLWQRGEKPLYHTLCTDLSVDVAVVGAGIAGLSTAYELSCAGLKVAVLDRERIGLGETGLSSAHLSTALDHGYARIEKLRGHAGAQIAAESHRYAIDRIEEIQARENIACEFERLDGFLFQAAASERTSLEAERAAIQRAGLSDVERVESVPGVNASGPALRFPRQAQLQPLLYIDGLAEAVLRLGGQIFTHSEVETVHGGDAPFVRTERGHTVNCRAVVMATNVPINNVLSVHLKNYAYRSYMIGLPVPPPTQKVLLWDTATPYHYVRYAKDLSTGETLLLVGGEDHRTGQDASPEHHFTELARWARECLGIDERIVTRWSGQILETADGLAYIGRNPGDNHNVFILTGDCGQGLTHATLGAKILCDAITGQANPWADLYNPSRLPMLSLKNFVREAAHSAAPYSDWLSTGDVHSEQDIARGEGAVLREGLRKVAVYRDETGGYHRCSAVCPHLGGLVRWNNAEKTWDCPCHGSRFDRFGEVLNGPANSCLPEVGEPLASIPLTRGPQAEV